MASTSGDSLLSTSVSCGRNVEEWKKEGRKGSMCVKESWSGGRGQTQPFSIMHVHNSNPTLSWTNHFLKVPLLNTVAVALFIYNPEKKFCDKMTLTKRPESKEGENIMDIKHYYPRKELLSKRKIKYKKTRD